MLFRVIIKACLQAAQHAAQRLKRWYLPSCWRGGRRADLTRIHILFFHMNVANLWHIRGHSCVPSVASGKPITWAFVWKKNDNHTRRLLPTCSLFHPSHQRKPACFQAVDVKDVLYVCEYSWSRYYCHSGWVIACSRYYSVPISSVLFQTVQGNVFQRGKLILRPFLELVISVSPSSRTSILNSPSGVW